MAKKPSGSEIKLSKEAYLHGYSSIEQDRLKYQAQFTLPSIYGNLDHSSVTELLEVGVGVGARSEILLRRFPQIKITAIDPIESQLSAARSYLARKSYAQNRFLQSSKGQIAYLITHAADQKRRFKCISFTSSNC